MIQPLRTVHRRVLFVLALVLPVLVAAGLVARDRAPAPPAPVISHAPEPPPGTRP